MNSIMNNEAHIYGLLAEFERPESMVDAARRTREAGYRCFDAFTPFPLGDEMAEAVGFRESILLWIALVVGIGTTVLGLFFLWYINVVDYPINVGGRPLAAWPAFILPTLHFSMLVTTVVSVVALFIMNRLPSLHHPLLADERFHLVSRDRFFVLIESRDPQFDPRATRDFLDSLKPVSVSEVPQC